MLKNGRAAVVILACSVVESVSAATFIVPSDRVFVQQTPAIVIASAIHSRTELNEKNVIETVTTMAVEETIKGSVEGPTIDVYEIGGIYGQRRSIVPGFPRFNDGERYLLLLVRTDDGHWRVNALVLGKFTFVTDSFGREFLVRDATEIAGLDTDGKVHSEKSRSAQPFLEFVRTASRGGPAKEDYFVSPSQPMLGNLSLQVPAKRPVPLAIGTPSSYTFNYTGGFGARWNVFPSPVTFKTVNANAAALTAMNAGIAGWNNDPNSNVNLVNGGADSSGMHLSGVGGADGQSTVLFESDLTKYGATPFSCAANSYCQPLGCTLGVGTVIDVAAQHTGPNNEQFWTALEGDVEMAQGESTCAVFINGGDFNSAVTHELGHTLGFRHTDQDRNLFTGAGPCSADASLECSTSAIMKAFIPSNLNGGLQTWDQHAVSQVYPTPPCTAPAISTQPVGTTITSGQSAMLTVAATGTATLTYQWYTGTSGVVTSPIGAATNTSVTVSPTTTTSYWVRVTNSCGTADSNTATVTVTTCTPPAITRQPGNTSLTTGNSTTISVVATGTSPIYQWFIGPSGTTTTQAPNGTNAALTVNPTVNTTYWVQVTACGTPVNSTAATVTVLPAGSHPRGDTNGDTSVGVGDVFYLISNQFAGGPGPVGSGDANGDGVVNVADIFYLINFLFSGGPAPLP